MKTKIENQKEHMGKNQEHPRSIPKVLELGTKKVHLDLES